MATRRNGSRPSTTLATWNLEWAKAGRARGKRAAALLDGCADIVVLTECDEQMLLEDGRIAPSAPWETEPSFDGARKVAMWSKFGWTAIDDAPIASVGGRCVVATTETAVGPLTVVGVCIVAAQGRCVEHRAVSALGEDNPSGVLGELVTPSCMIGRDPILGSPDDRDRHGGRVASLEAGGARCSGDAM